MRNITKYSLNHHSVIALMAVVMLIGGIYAFMTLGKKEDSTFVIKSAVVSCSYTGATPEEVESQVIVPLERAIRTLSSVHKITSEARYGEARIIVELNPSTRPSAIEQLWDELRRKVESARSELPEGIEALRVTDDYGDLYGLYYAIAGDKGFDYRELRDYSRELERRLYTISGVERVVLMGEQMPEINITLSAATLSAFDIRPEDISRAIAEQNDVAGLGQRRAGDISIELVEGSTYSSLQDIENQLLTAHDGKQYRIGDIARVERSYHKPQQMIVKVDERDAIAVGISTDPTRDIVAVGEEVAQEIAQMQQELPVGIDIISLYAENEIAREANYSFLLNLMESVVIVILLVMLAMGLRSGMVVGTSLLLAIGGTLLTMSFIGEGINRTSLAGFIIAMGMLVDNAIVVVDNTAQLSLRGTPLQLSAIEGATRPRYALFIATCIAIASFLPLQLARSSVAEVIRPLFVVIALSLLLSWVLSLTQVPIMSVRLLRPDSYRGAELHFSVVGRIVRTAVKHRYISLIWVIVIFLASLWAMGHMPQNFFPQLSKPYFRCDLLLPEGYDIEATTSEIDNISAWLMAQPEVKHVSTTAGGTPPRYYIASSSYASRPNYGNILVELHSAKDAERVKARLDGWAQQNLAEGWLRTSLFRLSPVAEATIEIGFRGDNIDTLARLTASAMDVMQTSNSAIDIRNSWGNRTAVWQPLYSQIKAQRLGVTRSSLITSLAISTSGKQVAWYREGDYAMPILLRAEPPSDTTLTALATMPIFSRGGRSFAIEQATSSFDVTYRPAVIRRIDAERVMKAQCEPRKGVNTIALMEQLYSDIKKHVSLPEGYDIDIYGEAESREESNEALAEKLPITLLIILLLLVMLFGNIRDPIVLLLTVPLIFTGVVLGLMLTGKMFDFFSLLGLLGLVGMNIKSGVILLQRIGELRQAGIAPAEAVVRAAEERTLPVVVASATTILGMVPLLFDSMFGSMAATIMGGLLVATMLVLVVLPVIYSIVYRVRL